MKGNQFIYLLAIASVSIAIEYRKVARPNQQLDVDHSDADDSELMQLEASGSKNKKKDKSDQDKVKTLSQQVVDGKYGLIQKELFKKKTKRPGILSYASNSEVPNDTIDNLGGLDKNEIWLAESHLLVLSGGSFPPYGDKKEHTESLWPPLDTYKASKHQVKIPPNPKVPPPFPVQLTKDGPLQILGTNFSRTLNETDKSALYPLSPPEGVPPGAKISTRYPNSSNTSAGRPPLPISIINPGEFSPGVSFPPSNLNETWPPFLGYLPPGAVILPPPGNQTDLYDDDDPSIYYPPPYSFFYHKDNSSAVPPGPLVPGIILPPPPDFFALLEETTQSTTTTEKLSTQRNRKPSTTTPKVQVSTTTTFLPPTTKPNEVTTEEPLRVYPVKNEFRINEKRPQKITTETPEIFTIFHVQNRTYLPAKTNRPHFVRKNPQNVTILRPVKSKTAVQAKTVQQAIPTQPSQTYLPKNEISQKPIKKNPIFSSTPVPLKYYTTSDHSATYSNSDQNKHKTTHKPADYYFYEEIITTPKSPPVQQNNYYGPIEEFSVQPKPRPSFRQRKPQYIYVTGRPYNTQKPRFRFIQQPIKPDTFRIHISKLQNQIHQYYTTVRTTKRPSPKPVYQYSFQAANYQPQNNFQVSLPEDDHQNGFKTVTSPPPKYSVQIQQAIEVFPTDTPKYHEGEQIYFQNNNDQQISKHRNNYYTTPKPNYHFEEVTRNPPFYKQETTSRPILQYSFEATPNPIYQGFYTKPEEGLFDENTREYFTVFGKKLVPSTTPLPGLVPVVPDSYSSPDEQGSVYQKNPEYHHQRQNAEHAAQQTHEQRYPNVVRYSPNPPEYQDSPKLNSREPEIIKAIEVPVAAKDTQHGSYVSYELPADDGAHFYFLTPKFSKENSRFYYSKPNIERVRRGEIESDKDR